MWSMRSRSAIRTLQLTNRSLLLKHGIPFLFLACRAVLQAHLHQSGLLLQVFLLLVSQFSESIYCTKTISAVYARLEVQI